MSNNSAPRVLNRTQTLLQSYGILEAIHKALEQGQAELEQVIGSPICIENCGKCCQVGTPVVLDTEIDYLISTLAYMPGVRDKLVDRSLDWLTHKHPGLTCYGKIIGQPKTEEEKKLITYEAVFLSTKQCPYLEGTRCIIHASRPLLCRRYGVTVPADAFCLRKLHWTEAPERKMAIARETELGRHIDKLCKRLCAATNGIAGHYTAFLPTAIARELAPDKYKQIAAEGKIADAKMAVGKPMLNLFCYRQQQ